MYLKNNIRIIYFIIINIFLFSNPVLAKDYNLQDAFSPNQGATALVVKIIGEAKETIQIAAYSFTSRPIAEALVEAHKKGVKVQIVLDKSQRKGRGTLVPFFQAHHIPARINSHYAIMHNKFRGCPR